MPTERYKYKDVIPLRTHESKAWIVEIEGGPVLLSIWDKSSKVEDLVRSTKVFYPGKKFTVETITVGEFILKSTVHSLSMDGRKINQDLEVIL